MFFPGPGLATVLTPTHCTCDSVISYVTITMTIKLLLTKTLSWIVAPNCIRAWKSFNIQVFNSTRRF